MVLSSADSHGSLLKRNIGYCVSIPYYFLLPPRAIGYIHRVPIVITLTKLSPTWQYGSSMSPTSRRERYYFSIIVLSSAESNGLLLKCNIGGCDPIPCYLSLLPRAIGYVHRVLIVTTLTKVRERERD